MIFNRSLNVPALEVGDGVEGRLAALERQYRSLIDALVADRLALNQPGAVDIADAVINATNGIKFPATQNASTDANTLDDYEEGTWTPADGSGAGLSLTITSARYTKIGRLVLAQCHVVYPATASGASSQINGLPFSTQGIHTAEVYTNGAGGATVAQVSGAVINIFAPGNVAITNANLSGAFVVLTVIFSS